MSQPSRLSVWQGRLSDNGGRRIDSRSTGITGMGLADGRAARKVEDSLINGHMRARASLWRGSNLPVARNLPSYLKALPFGGNPLFTLQGAANYGSRPPARPSSSSTSSVRRQPESNALSRQHATVEPTQTGNSIIRQKVTFQPSHGFPWAFLWQLLGISQVVPWQSTAAPSGTELPGGSIWN